MKEILFCLLFSNFLYSQIDSDFRNKKEVFCGINYPGNLGVNAGYISRIGESKFYYRVDAQFTKRYFSNTQSNPHDGSFYNDLAINSVVLNNMISYRAYQKRHDRLYFDLGAYLGINLWQQKKGQKTGYAIIPTDFKKDYFFLPNELGLHLGFGIRVSKHILLKPELRLGLLSFDKLFEDSGFFDEMMMNASFTPSFNISYLF